MNPTALIIADDDSVRIALARVFQDAHFTVLSASDDAQALQLFRARLADLVILNVHDGGRCTTTAARALKDYNQFVPIILLAHKIDPVSPDHPADALLFNPIDINELLATAQKFVTESAETRLARVCGNNPACRYAAGFQAPLFRSLDERHGRLTAVPARSRSDYLTTQT